MENNSEKLLPTYCCIALLESCFMHCKMCYKWQEDVSVRHRDEPSPEQWRSFLDDLARLCPAHKPQINFAGGEPLAREETLGLMRYAAELGFSSLLVSNAYLIDERKAREIALSGVESIVISLDGVTARTHDFLRGVEGSFQRVMNAIDLLHRYAPKTRINLSCVICAVNLRELADLVRWAESDTRIEGVRFQAVTQPFNTPEQEDWYKDGKYSFLWPQDKELTEKVLDELADLKENGNFRNTFWLGNSAGQLRMYKRYFSDPQTFVKKIGCHLDMRALNVTPGGSVHICFYKPSLGNIKQQSILDIWGSEQTREVQDSIKACRRNCQAMINCNFEEEESYIT